VLEIPHLIRRPEALPSIDGMFSSPTAKANATSAVLSRLCNLPGAYILGRRGYRFDYVFLTPTFRQYGPLTVDLADCVNRSPFAQ